MQTRFRLATLPHRFLRGIPLISCLGLLVFSDLEEACAQGSVRFANNATSAISNLLTQAKLVAGNQFTVALYYMPDEGQVPTSVDFDRAAFPCRPWATLQAPGVFGDGLRTTPTNTAAGDWAWFQVRAWETAYGASYEEALAAPPKESPPEGSPGGVGLQSQAGTPVLRRALVGTSNIIRVRTGGSLTPTNTVGSPAFSAAASVLRSGIGAALSAYPPDAPSLTDFGLAGFVLSPQTEVTSLSVDPLITFETLAGLRYAVEKTVDLESPDWQPLPGAESVVGTGGLLSVSDPGAGCLDVRFYRIRVVP